MKIGIGVTTVPERDAIFQASHIRLNRFRPSVEIILVVNVDKSHEGIPASKNKCLNYLHENECDHIFLFDDDTFPIADDWWRPYVESKEPHLMYQFKLPGRGPKDMTELYRDDKTVAYSHTRGAMLYVERRVLDVVGGMDTDYGLGMYEHTDWTNRIHNAGLTTHRAMDVPGSDKLLYCFDQDSAVESSIKELRGNHKLYVKNRWSKEFKEFR